jgi:hypothetical protein
MPSDENSHNKIASTSCLPFLIYVYTAPGLTRHGDLDHGNEEKGEGSEEERQQEGRQEEVDSSELMLMKTVPAKAGTVVFGTQEITRKYRRK